MPVTRRQLQQQLDGDNAGQDIDEPPTRHVLRTPSREQFLEDELWVVQSGRECEPPNGFQPDCPSTHILAKIIKECVWGLLFKDQDTPHAHPNELGSLRDRFFLERIHL